MLPRPQVRKGESGQALILAALLMAVLMGFVALTIDIGLFLQEKRHLQNAADAAALAAVAELPDDPGMAVSKALEWAAKNGYDNADPNVTVTADTPYQGSPSKIKVTITHSARPFIFARALGLDFVDISATAAAEHVVGGGTGSEPGGGNVQLPPVTDANCNNRPGNPMVDGRAGLADEGIYVGYEDEGYEKVGNLVANGVDYGDSFFTCDDQYFYLALRLNGPATGGAVSNENVFGPKVKKKDPPGYHEVFQTGWEKHDFKALKNSDRARFLIVCDGTPVHDFVQDYLYPGGPGGWSSGPSGDGEVIVAGPDQSASSLEWNLENSTFDGGWNSGLSDKQWKSPDFDPLYPDPAPEAGDWVWEMIYEFRLPRSMYAGCSSIVFGLSDFAGATGPLQGIHSSPAKVEGAEFVEIEPIDIIKLIQ